MIEFFARSDGAWWHFLSGVVLALAGNLVIAALSPEKHQSNFTELLIAGLLLFTASGCFSATGWTLGRLELIARNQLSDSMDGYLTSKKRLIGAAIANLLLYVLGVIILVIVALGLASSGQRSLLL